jgi:hypothetical protein
MQLPEWQGTKNSEFRGEGGGVFAFLLWFRAAKSGLDMPGAAALLI